MSEKNYAVLTGDIVESRKLSSERSKALQERLKSAAAEFEETFPGTVIGRLGITRGDGWQVALEKPGFSLRLALYLRAIVKAEFGTDSRVSIGIGPVDRLEAGNIVESTGPAFEHSGHGLEALRKKHRMVFSAGECEEFKVAQPLMGLLDLLVQRWTERQSFVASHLLLNRTQEEIAELSPVDPRRGSKPTRQAVSKTQDQMGFNRIEETVLFIEEATFTGCNL